MGGVCELPHGLEIRVGSRMLIDVRAEAFWNDGIDNTGHIKSVSYHQYAAGNADWVRLGSKIADYVPADKFD